jgi:hypothetical protein
MTIKFYFLLEKDLVKADNAGRTIDKIFGNANDIVAIIDFMFGN